MQDFLLFRWAFLEICTQNVICEQENSDFLWKLPKERRLWIETNGKEHSLYLCWYVTVSRHVNSLGSIFNFCFVPNLSRENFYHFPLCFCFFKCQSFVKRQCWMEFFIDFTKLYKHFHIFCWKLKLKYVVAERNFILVEKIQIKIYLI